MKYTRSKNSFIFDKSWYEAIKLLPVNRQLKMYENIIDYAFCGEVHNEITKEERSILVMICSDIKDKQKEKKLPNIKNDYSYETLEKRKSEFAQYIAEYKRLYERNVLLDFYNYWTQCNVGTFRMLWEKQRDTKCFDIKKRLSTWVKNSKNYGKQTKRNYSDKDLADSVQKGINFADYERGL